MKYNNFSAFEKHVRHSAPNHFAPVYLLISPDDFERQTAEMLLRKHILGENQSSSQASTYQDAGALLLSDLKNELNSNDLFTSRRVVILQNLENIKKNIKEYLEEYFHHPSPSLCLIGSAASLNRGTTLYKNAEKSGVILDIEEKKPWELEKIWVEKVIASAANEGKTIEPSAAQMLVKQIGTNSALLHHEFEKLLCYVGKRSTISSQDVRAICTGIPSETVWQLGDAIFQRNTGNALRIGLSLLEEGAPFLSLLRQIRSQFQVKLQLCSIQASGGTPAEITALFPYMRGTILEKNISMARSYGLERFRQGMMLIDDFELEAKNGNADSTCLAERLLAKLTL